MARIPAELQEKNEEDCFHASQHALYITFTPGDMEVKGNMIYFYTSHGILDCLK